MARKRRFVESSVNRFDVAVVRHYPRVRSALQMLEDRRVFHPEGAFRRPLSFSSPKRPRLVVRKANFGSTMPSRIGFKVPKKVSLCVRRKERREVFMAKRLKRGKGAGRRNYWSEISC